VIGVGVSLWTSRYIGALLYGLAPGDPLTLAGATVVLLSAGVVAAGLPAWRAARIDPALVLRED
jgi:putative ABC transport system permease protein